MGKRRQIATLIFQKCIKRKDNNIKKGAIVFQISFTNSMHHAGRQSPMRIPHVILHLVEVLKVSKQFAIWLYLLPGHMMRVVYQFYRPQFGRIFNIFPIMYDFC